MTDRPSRRRDLVPVPTAEAGGDGDDARRSRRRSRSAAPAEPTEANLTTLPVPTTPPTSGEASTPTRANRRKRDDGQSEKIHLQSEPIEGEDNAEETTKAEKETKRNPVLEKFHRETSTYSDYAFRLIFSRTILVIAMLCFGWALWQAFHAVITNYFRNL